MTNKSQYSAQRFLDLLKVNGLTVDCLSQFCWHQLEVSRNVPENKRDRNITEERYMRGVLYQQIFEKNEVDAIYFRALHDLIESIQNTVDNSVNQIRKENVALFSAVQFKSAADYDVYAFPLCINFSCHAFNTYMKNVVKELDLYGIKYRVVKFNGQSYLDYIKHLDETITSLHTKREQMILSWANAVKDERLLLIEA